MDGKAVVAVTSCLYINNTLSWTLMQSIYYDDYLLHLELVSLQLLASYEHSFIQQLEFWVQLTRIGAEVKNNS